MRLILPADFHTQTWKNGGGITHEIARADHDGRLLWRLSIAEVASDGPFSAFPDLSRILTVIEGVGLHLDTPTERLTALPLTPLAFSGDLAVQSQLINGPIRDFNVIFDSRHTSARVSLVADGQSCPAAAGRHYACLALTPGMVIDGVAIPSGAIALFKHSGPISLMQARGLLVIFEQIP